LLPGHRVGAVPDLVIGDDHGTWERRHGHPHTPSELDVGLRLFLMTDVS
jgi:hypothetical protein